MAALIIEILSRHGSQYHPIDKAVVRVGRALDNDIILADPSVSPYHFAVRRTADGSYRLHSLADENGIRIGGRQITEPLSLEALPLELDAGRTRVRILDRSQPVAPTRMISCLSAGRCVFGHWGWALLLFAFLVGLSALDNYLSTPQLLTWQSFWRDQVVILTTALALSLGLLIVNRLTSHRWDYPSCLSFVSLVLITAYLLDQFIPFADYLFTSPLPGYAISIAWVLMLLPLALAWFLVRLHHGNTAGSILLIILMLTPAAYLQIKDLVTHYDLLDDFTKKAFYSDALYPWDKRIAKTLSIDEFLQISSERISPDKQHHPQQ